MKCPFCQFDNEDGALFCEQCKSDLGIPEPVAVGHAAEAQHSASAESSVTVEEPPATIPVTAEGMLPVADVVAHDEVITEAVAVAEVADTPAALAETLAPTAIPAVEAMPAVESTPAVEAAPAAEEPPAVEATLLPAEAAAAETLPPVEVTSPAPAAKADADGAQAAAPAAAAAEAKPKLLVVRGQRVNVEYPIYEGDNYIGRADDKAVDIDLEDQEPQDRIWSSRQHALITLENGNLAIEDLDSTNGTFVNRMRIQPRQKRPLQANDVIQIGTVQMKVKV